MMGTREAIRGWSEKRFQKAEQREREEEARKKEIRIAIEEARAKVGEEIIRKFEPWNNRRLAAQDKCEPFNEPLPRLSFVDLQRETDVRHSMMARRESIDEWLEQSHQKALEEGIGIGRRNLSAETKAWNSRRLAAKARGELFNEPIPQ